VAEPLRSAADSEGRTRDGLICKTCGTRLRDVAKFCDACGAAVSATSKKAEYKQVTVLIADVVRSMALTAAVGAERFREIVAQLVDIAAVIVQRNGGIIDKFTGDGFMALFGAPIALEDHAIRACRAALDIQNAVGQLTVDVARHDNVELSLRIGLSSGQVVVGGISSAAAGYTAIGEQVGMAQRMEAAAEPGAVMLSESTVRLVEGAVILAEPQTIRVKGATDPVHPRSLIGIAPRAQTASLDVPLIGREGELAALIDLVDHPTVGKRAVVAVVGPAGRGKTRLVAEVAAHAENRGFDVIFTFCESHLTEVSFRVVARLLRAMWRMRGLDDVAARIRVRENMSGADPDDLLLLDDLLGIGAPNVKLPDIDPESRRRRLTALIIDARLRRSHPALFVVEDVHWIDRVSESMIADFLASGSRTSATVLLTYRPEYRGALRDIAGGQTITLGALSDSQTSKLVTGLIGTHPSVTQISHMVIARAGGNPFFAKEITQELAERGILVGEPGMYTCVADAGEVVVPATLQATLAARIDRLSPAAKNTLCAASVIGTRFSSELLGKLGITIEISELISAELVDPAGGETTSEYTIRHPLIREVAYGSLLAADRARLHRQLAAAIEDYERDSGDQSAGLIAEHLQAAGDLQAAYRWHLRAAAWAADRDRDAAQRSRLRAERIVDSRPAADS
jgi:class 3 adenylate cyclase